MDSLFSSSSCSLDALSSSSIFILISCCLSIEDSVMLFWIISSSTSSIFLIISFIPFPFPVPSLFSSWLISINCFFNAACSAAIRPSCSKVLLLLPEFLPFFLPSKNFFIDSICFLICSALWGRPSPGFLFLPPGLLHCPEPGILFCIWFIISLNKSPNSFVCIITFCCSTCAFLVLLSVKFLMLELRDLLMVCTSLFILLLNMICLKPRAVKESSIILISSFSFLWLWPIFT